MNVNDGALITRSHGVSNVLGLLMSATCVRNALVSNVCGMITIAQKVCRLSNAGVPKMQSGSRALCGRVDYWRPRKTRASLIQWLWSGVCHVLFWFTIGNREIRYHGFSHSWKPLREIRHTHGNVYFSPF